jgi:signal peptidase I
MRLLRVTLVPLALAIVLALAARSMVHIYAIPSPSMEPTLEAGDHIVVLRDAHPGRGDVIVFRAPAATGDELLVKRLIAVPGDLIATSGDGRVVISGHPLAERYLPAGVTTSTIAAQIVPAGCYFVLGDNRANSADSRTWGVLPANLVVGRAVLVLWSSGATRLFRRIR